MIGNDKYNPINRSFILFLLIFASMAKTVILFGEQNIFFNLELMSGRQQYLTGDFSKIGFYRFSNNKNKNQSTFVNLSAFEYKKQFIGGNFGVGIRKQYGNKIVGYNLYLDHKNEKKALYRIGFGFEYFSNIFGFYGNAYFPIGNRQYEKKHYFFDDYVGEYEVSCTRKKIVPTEFDLNLCKNFYPTNSSDIQVSSGIYMANFHECAEVLGFQGSVKITLLDRMYVKPELYYDKKFKTNYSITLGYTFKLDKHTTINKTPTRNWIIKSIRHCDYKTNY